MCHYMKGRLAGKRERSLITGVLVHSSPADKCGVSD